MRRLFDLHGYLGHMVGNLFEDEVDVFRPSSWGDSWGDFAECLLEDEQIRYQVQAFATVLTRPEDRERLAPAARLDLERDMILSSHANIRCCELSYGPILGTPDAVRRPRMPPSPSLLYIMPKDKEGGIAVAFCLREDELTILRADDVLKSYASYIG